MPTTLAAGMARSPTTRRFAGIKIRSHARRDPLPHRAFHAAIVRNMSRSNRSFTVAPRRRATSRSRPDTSSLNSRRHVPENGSGRDESGAAAGGAARGVGRGN